MGKKRRIKKPPAPIKPVGTTWWIPRDPEPIQIPTDWAVGFPSHLTAQGEVIIGEAVRRFPTRDEMPRFCRHLVARFTPMLASEESGLRPDLALLRIGELVDSFLIANYRDFKPLQTGIRKSREWLKLAKTLAERSTKPASEQTAREAPKESDSGKEAEPPVLQSPPSRTNRAIWEGYRREVREKTGKHLRQKDVWSQFYSDRTELQRWLKQNPKYFNAAAHEKFRNLLLVEKPHLK